MAPAVGLAGDATAMAPAAGLTGDATTMVPASEFGGSEREEPAAGLLDGRADGELFADEMDEYGTNSTNTTTDEYGDGDFDEAEPAQLTGRSLLIGNAVVAFAVVGLASLAAAIAIAVRPTASQQPVVGLQNAAPGKFMPILPSQQQAPVPPPPVDQPNAGYQGGTVPAPDRRRLGSRAGCTALRRRHAGRPVPVGPGTPGWGPNPNPLVPVPIPIPIPFPGWRPNYSALLSADDHPPSADDHVFAPDHPPRHRHRPTTSSPPTTTSSPPTTTSALRRRPLHAAPPTTVVPSRADHGRTLPTTVAPHAPSTKPTTQVPTQTQQRPCLRRIRSSRCTPQQPRPRRRGPAGS